MLLAAASVGAAGQEPGRVRVEVRAGGDAVAGATVVVEGTSEVTDAAGVALVPAPAGVVQVTVAHEGFVPITVPVTLAGGAERVVRVELEPELTIEEEITVVASTRTGRRIEDQPMRVEALNREEIEEKMLMTPGDIVMMLNEMGGMRVQATSPSLGAASVRIQGMRGRYTRFLSDGLPLYGSQPGGLGLLQIPPMDLGQVEVIKGVASALHGAGAMGGVVNLLSRRPGDEPEREILFNQSTRGATDGVVWLSTPLSDAWGMTLIGGGHRQNFTDVDGDGWAELDPSMARPPRSLLHVLDHVHRRRPPEPRQERLRQRIPVLDRPGRLAARQPAGRDVRQRQRLFALVARRRAPPPRSAPRPSSARHTNPSFG